MLEAICRLGIYVAGFLFWVGLALNLNQDFLVLEMIAPLDSELHSKREEA